MDIYGEITGIRYELFTSKELVEIVFNDFDVNTMPASCLISDKKYNFSISKWVSPKRTRSYPFERVYNMLSNQKRITVIPIIKDEGIAGDRDYIQWDTISLMSLLDVYVIFAYYDKAEKHKTKENKITSQKFPNEYVKKKIKEISNYHSSPLHWNLQEIHETLPSLIDTLQNAYNKISKELNVEMHSSGGIEKFKTHFFEGVEEFMQTSRRKAKEAQNRERLTMQPKEALSTETKATITIKNYLGGLYYLTTDEIKITKKKLYLIEAKHSSKSKLPSISDIKDGLLKMILYCNIKNVSIDNKAFTAIPILKLTSSQLIGNLTSEMNEQQYRQFYTENQLTQKQQSTIASLLQESKQNHFRIIIEKGQISD